MRQHIILTILNLRNNR